MQFDDRLATVLRSRADSDAVLRTKYRQLLDLLGTSKEEGDSELRAQAYARLNELAEALPQEEQARILREPGLRLRNPALVAFLARGEAKPGASAMATARLTDEEWLELIPKLPVTARGFLRHRRDLSPAIKALLARLGVGDLVLPEPEGDAAARSLRQSSGWQSASPPISTPISTPASTPISAPASPPARTSPAPSASKLTNPLTSEEAGIGALLKRIEAFRETRRSQPNDPRLPMGEDQHVQPLQTIEFSCDTDGMAVWADENIAPMIVGMQLTSSRTSTLITMDLDTKAAFAARQPVYAARITVNAAPEISGQWHLDAAPLFDPATGSFIGYRGCLRHAVEIVAAEEESEADAMRQVLHELRTPVNAIQGFAEIIQQQLFGQVPHQYRAHAASIGVDSATLLAGFDEVDRLVQLEADTMELEPGTADLRAAVSETVQRLQAVLRPRHAGFSLNVSGGPFVTALSRSEALALCWRLLATAAGALAPGEEVDLVLTSDGSEIQLELAAPRSLTDGGMADPAESGRQRAVNAGMFGPAFAFRLAQAEAKSAGGYLNCKTNRVTLVVPALTVHDGEPSAGKGRIGE
ncbi:sensor histidine kinase [Aurantiacibacter marinus]|uniref:histidine kinase n=1 Tax=Aurantiacibacter marinus TaxID=874156 RepID=A0A0H0XMB5_9SPHN|nr:hypothetical protein [Aurantiacibacter marinus]KLI63161.1 hypothetical protein AAV99_10755 [Aurantiacibacter marinus]